MAEKKATTKAAPVKKAATKKAAAPKKTTAKESALFINAESVGFRAGDVYQALAAAGKAMSVAQRLAQKRFILVLAGSSKRARLKTRTTRLHLHNIQ